MNRNGQERGESVNGFPPHCSVAMSFPALSFSRGLVLLIDSTDNITRCTKLGLKKGFYQDLVVVDSNSYRFQAVDAREVRRLRFKFSLRGFLSFLDRNPDLEIEIFFESSPAKMSVEEVKKMIFNSFRREKHLWEEMSDFEEFQNQISAVASLEQIFAIFQNFKKA